MQKRRAGKVGVRSGYRRAAWWADRYWVSLVYDRYDVFLGRRDYV